MAMNAISSLMLDSSSPVLTLKSQPCLYLIKKTEITWKEYPQAPTAHLSTFQHLYCPGSILSCHCEWLCSCLGQPSTCPFDPSPPHLFKDNAPAIVLPLTQNFQYIDSTTHPCPLLPHDLSLDPMSIIRLQPSPSPSNVLALVLSTTTYFLALR